MLGRSAVSGGAAAAPPHSVCRFPILSCGRTCTKNVNLINKSAAVAALGQ